MSKKVTDFFERDPKKTVSCSGLQNNVSEEIMVNIHPVVVKPTKPFHPLSSFMFPKTKIGGRDHSCQAH